MFCKKIADSVQIIVADLNDAYLEELTSFLNEGYQCKDFISLLSYKLSVFKSFLLREGLFEFYENLPEAKDYSRFSRKQKQYYYLFEDFIKIEERIVKIILAEPLDLPSALRLSENIINARPALELKTYILNELALLKLDPAQAATIRELNRYLQKNMVFGEWDDYISALENGGKLLSLSFFCVLERCSELPIEEIMSWMKAARCRGGESSFIKLMFIAIVLFKKDQQKSLAMINKLTNGYPDSYLESFYAFYAQKYELVKSVLDKTFNHLAKHQG